MADITVNDIVMSGVIASFGAAASGDTIPIAGDDRVYLEVINANGASINVTITKQTTSVNVPGEGSVTLSNRVVAVADGTRKKIGPFNSSDIDPTNGKVSIAWSATTGVTRAAFRVPARK